MSSTRVHPSGGEELGSGSDGDASDTQIAADHITVRTHNRSLCVHNDVQIEASLPLVPEEVCRTGVPEEVTLVAGREVEGDIRSAADGGEGGDGTNNCAVGNARSLVPTAWLFSGLAAGSLSQAGADL